MAGHSGPTDGDSSGRGAGGVVRRDEVHAAITPIRLSSSADLSDTGSTMNSERDHISRAEIRKDAVQDSVDATINAVAAVGGVITHAARDIARTVGGLATELFEIRDAARRADREHGDA